MLHGAARELRRYNEVEAYGWRLLGLLGRGQYAVPRIKFAQNPGEAKG